MILLYNNNKLDFSRGVKDFLTPLDTSCKF